MEFFNIENVLFTVDGRGVSFLEACAMLCGLSCVFLATRARKENFWIGYVYNILLFALFWQKYLYSSMLLQPISLIINIFGHYRWTHPRKEEATAKKELKITLLSWRQRSLYILAWATLAVLWGFLLSRLHLWNALFPAARQPYLDAFVSITMILSMFLSAQKKLDCWGGWMTANVTNLILYLRSGLVFMPIVAAAYMVMASIGYRTWLAKMKNEK